MTVIPFLSIPFLDFYGVLRREEFRRGQAGRRGAKKGGVRWDPALGREERGSLKIPAFGDAWSR
jgi:hypothetical protein